MLGAKQYPAKVSQRGKERGRGEEMGAHQGDEVGHDADDVNQDREHQLVPIVLARRVTYPLCYYVSSLCVTPSVRWQDRRSESTHRGHRWHFERQRDTFPLAVLWPQEIEEAQEVCELDKVSASGGGGDHLSRESSMTLSPTPESIFSMLWARPDTEGIPRDIRSCDRTKGVQGCTLPKAVR